MNPNFFNLSKRKKRDILSELLVGKSSEGMISKKEISALNKLIGGTSQLNSLHNRHPEKTKEITVRKKKKETKKKTTHYLSEEVFDNLEATHKKILSILPENSRSDLSRSQIVNQALALILKEFEVRGKNSSLVRSMVQRD